jgi:hypothetical protein
VNCSTVRFDNGNSASVVRAADNTPVEEILAALALPAPRALVVLNGGTARLERALQKRLAAALADGLARVVAEERLTVITGGTDAGVFHIFGEGLTRWGRTAPCIGVAVAELVAHPGHPGGEASLEPNHSHFILTTGRHWGDETATMYALVAALARDCPSLAVFAGGGEITLREMQANVAQGRAMLLLAGSGRNTDAVLDAVAGEPSANTDLDAVARSPGIVPVSIEDDPTQLRATVRRLLFGGGKAAG